MKCPKRQAENPEIRKFCRDCGAKLVQVCPNCGCENLPRGKFCSECGHSLAFPPEPIPQALSLEKSWTRSSVTYLEDSPRTLQRIGRNFQYLKLFQSMNTLRKNR